MCFIFAHAAFVRVKLMMMMIIIITPPPIGSAEYCNERVCPSVCLCVCVCLSVREHISRTARPDVLCMFGPPVAVARSSSGGVAISYVFPVLWMTSYLCICNVYIKSAAWSSFAECLLFCVRLHVYVSVCFLSSFPAVILCMYVFNLCCQLA